MAGSATSAFNQLSQYANSPGHRAYCYAELAVSSLAVAATIMYSFRLPMEGWPGWVGLGGLVEHQEGIPRERSPISALTRLDVVSNFVDLPNDVTTKPNRHLYSTPRP